jgi:site-specific recombinase XerD
MGQLKIKVLLKADKPLSNSTIPIWIRITYQRKASYLATGYSCQELEWNSEAGRLYESKQRLSQGQKNELNPSECAVLKKAYSAIRINPLAKKINADIDRLVRKILSVKDRLEANDQSISVKSIKKHLEAQNSGISDKSFIKYWEAQNSILEKKNAYRTLKTQKSILKQLKGEGQVEGFLKGKDLQFDEITVSFLEEYQAYLKGRGYSKTTIHNHLKTFRRILYKAIKEPAKNYFSQDKNPFFAFKLEADRPQRKARLNAEEIAKLEALNLEKGTRIYDARNMFLFSFYCAGVRIGDLLQLKWSNIKEGRLNYVMGKNDKERSIKLLPNALKIIRLYQNKGQSPDDYIFPFLANNLNRANVSYVHKQIEAKAALINKCLKQVAVRGEIGINLTTHMARHSFADMARKKKVSLLDIQKMLAHSDSKTTQIYLNSFDLESQDEAHESVFRD